MLNNAPSLPYFEAYIQDGQVIPQWTPCVEISQEINSHSVAFLDVEYVGSPVGNTNFGKSNTWSYIPEGTPVQIVYGQRPHSLGNFLGYVSSYSLVRQASDIGYSSLVTTRVRYTLTGPSQVMQTTKNTAWKNIGISSIASQIATKNGLRSIVHTYTSAIPYRLQNTSDFTFLRNLSKEIGYHFYVDNTDLYFVNPKILLDRNNGRLVPQFWSFNQPGLYDTIRSFTPIVGSITPDGGISANRNIVGLNPNTGQIVQAYSKAPVALSPVSTIDKYYTQYPAESYFEASQKVAASSSNNMYWNTATATLNGDARVKPNSLVNLTGSSLPSTEAGYWLVRGATHRLTKPAPSANPRTGTYQVDTELIRDTVYNATTTIASPSSPSTQVVPGKLVGGRWISSNMGASSHAD